MNQFFKIIILLQIVLGYLNISGQEAFAKELNGKWGYVDKSGVWLIKPKFINARDFSEGAGAVQKGRKWGFVNLEGKFVVKPKYGYVLDYSEGLAAMLSYKPLTGLSREGNMKRKWGYLNPSGEVAVPFSFRSAKSFVNGIALVSSWGQHDKEQYMIGKDGAAISVPFITRTPYADDLYHLVNVRQDGDSVYKYIKRSGANVTKWYVEKFEFKNFPVQVFLPTNNSDEAVDAFSGSAQTKFVAMLNKDGEVFTDWFNAIGEFNRGVVPVRYKHKWGFADSNYAWVSEPAYRDIELLRDGFYEGQINANSSVLIDHTGKRLSHEVENFDIFDADFFVADYKVESRRRKDKYVALYDSLGRQRTGWYENINPFSNGISRVEDVKNTLFSNDSVGLKRWCNYVVDSTGEVLCFWRPEVGISWKLKDRAYKDSVLSVLYAPNAAMHLTEEYFKTTYIKTFRYDKKKRRLLFNGGDFSEGMALVAKKVGVIKKKIEGIEFIIDDVRYGYVDWNGKQVIPYRYKEASNFSGGKAIISDGKYYGAIDFRGRMLIKPQYQLMGSFGSGLAPVYKDGVWGYVNGKNRLVVDYQYEDARPFRFGFAAVKKGKEWGVIDVRGNMVLDFNYRKPPKSISESKVEVLKRGVGYVVMDIK